MRSEVNTARLRALEHRNQEIFSIASELRKFRLVLFKMTEHGYFGTREKIVRPGQYGYMRRTESISAYLLLACLPQNPQQITNAITRGRVKTKAKDDLRATQSALRYGLKTGRFRKFDGHNWMPGL